SQLPASTRGSLTSSSGPSPAGLLRARRTALTMYAAPAAAYRGHNEVGGRSAHSSIDSPTKPMAFSEKIAGTARRVRVARRRSRSNVSNMTQYIARIAWVISSSWRGAPPGAASIRTRTLTYVNGTPRTAVVDQSKRYATVSRDAASGTDATSVNPPT